MFDMPPDNEDPPRLPQAAAEQNSRPENIRAPANGQERPNLVNWVKKLLKGKSDSGIRAAIEEYIEVTENNAAEDSISAHERDLLANILKLGKITVYEVMVPRADIVSIDVSTPQNELLKMISENTVSRLPVYKDTLDEVLGTVHIKDILASLSKNKKVNLKELVTEVPIVSPSMPVLDLLLEMRTSRRHMALVVDEFGGIDGLITIGDIIEAIVGEIEDEHDEEEAPSLREKEDGSVVADARVDMSEFEQAYGIVFTEEEREESDTLGGVVSFLAGRVPARGEILTHESGIVFEILDADPRRINKLRIRNIPKHAE